MNNTFRIAYGDYDLEIDRGRLTYRLTETKTGTVWADGLPVGWIEFEDRFTEGVSRYDFGQTTLFSLSEKAGAGGKEILFGLECLGVPIDLLFTCAEKEIRLTVEANRDSKTHRVSEVCLLPDLCGVPDDGVSHLVVPHGEGALVLARDAPARPQFLRVWDDEGLSMPFFGAVRAAGNDNTDRSALALITDSAYGAVRLEREEDASASLSLHFARDPERRRLELRVVPLPESDHVAIARAYRDKVIADRQHVTLRRKVRDKPEVDGLLGAALVLFPIRMAGHHLQAFADAAEVARDLKNELGVERALCVFHGWETEGGARGPFPAFVGAGGDIGLRQASDDLRALGFLAGASLRADAGQDALEEIKRRYEMDALALLEVAAAPLEDDPDGNRSRWDDMDRRMDRIALAREHFAVFGSGYGCDWSSVVCDWWQGAIHYPAAASEGPVAWSALAPLGAAVYHDSAVAYPWLSLSPSTTVMFLRCLLSLSPPYYYLSHDRYFDPAEGERDYIRRTYAVLAPLHRLSFPAFLTEHRFLTPDFAVEESRYSNGARVVINGGGTPYEDDDLLLPPQGFFVEHPQMVAHDAGRVGAETFPARAWRIVRARDDKPLAGSADVERREFPV